MKATSFSSRQLLFPQGNFFSPQGVFFLLQATSFSSMRFLTPSSRQLLSPHGNFFFLQVTSYSSRQLGSPQGKLFFFRVWWIPFLTEYKYRILFGFQKSPNTEHRILFGIGKIWIPDTEYYSVSRRSKYRIRIVLFGLTIQILNTKYQIVHKIWKKMKLKLRYLSPSRHFVLKICETFRRS